MTINVTKYRLNPDRIFGGTRGSYGMEKLSFDFGDGWDFDTISVTFHPKRGKSIEVPILPGTEIDIPAEVMEYSGETRFVVSGRVIGEDGAIERQAITLEGYVDVAYTADEKGGNTRKITPDVYDQLIDQASKVFNEAREDVEQSATEAEESAKRAEDAAKNINSVAEKANEAIKAAEEAKNAKKAAEQSASDANSAKDTAVNAAEAAQESSDSAAEAKNAAENSANSAGRSAQEAESAAARAEEAAEEAGKLVENIHETGNGVWYGTTSSEVREGIKEVTTVSGDFKLEKGSKVSVKFLTNSEYCQALNVDGTGVVYIHESYVDGAEDLPAGTAPNLWHNLGQINTFIYDGKYFIVEDGVRATADNRLLGKVGVSDSVTFDSGDYAASSRAVKRAYDKAVEAYEKAESGGGSGGGITNETDPTVPAWAKEPDPPKYTAEDVGALPASTKIPAKTSDITNDSGYITIAVATLLNYYLKTETYAKTETYSQTEVDNLISGLDKRLNAIADSEDVDLDQLSEIVAYIKANKSLIDSITTDKVNVADIIDNLTTADSKKPLSAAQGKDLKAMYDALPAWAKAANKPTYSKSEVGLGNVDNVQQYSASNPPPYPVTSVNGQTGAVTVTADGIGAATTGRVKELAETIATLTLGIASDGLCYVFIKGVPVGTGIPLGAVADIYGYIDENNHIVLEGVKNGGEYTYAFVLENGSTIHGGEFEYDDNTYYSVTSNLTNCTISNNAKTVVEGGSYAATISANSGYELKSVTVTMGGNTVSVSGGNINIASVTGNIVIVAVAEKVVIPTYAITNNLTNCTNSNSATSIQQGSAYSATITAKSGYELKSVSATMGGTAVSVSNGVVSIASVTGDIVITAVAEEIVVNYTNLFNPSSAVLNARLNSSKTLVYDANATGKMTTNFMDVSGYTPFLDDTKIYIKGATFTPDGNTKVLSYKTESGTDYTTAYSTLNGTSLTVKDEGNGVISISNLATTFASGVRRMVMTLKVKDSAITAADIANIIITVNEPIG